MSTNRRDIANEVMLAVCFSALIGGFVAACFSLWLVAAVCLLVVLFGLGWATVTRKF